MGDVQAAQREADAVTAEASTRPLAGHGTMNEGSRSQWYANGVRDAATRIRPTDPTGSTKP